MNKKTVRDIDLKDKKVLVRCDFNVPMDENKNITDNRRIVAALPTIQYLLEQNCKIVLCSHLGRPKGEFKPEVSLAPVAKELSKQLNKEVIMAKDVIGEDACKKAKKLNNGEILLLENLRFHREETDNDPEFAKTHVPMKRYGKEGELNSAVIFLAANESTYVTGTILPVDGGYTSV